MKRNIFDLHERLDISLGFLNNNVDEEKGLLPYFATMFKNDPAEARHDWPDFSDLTSRYIEAFVLARKILGQNKPGEIEQGQRRLLLSYFDENDGLNYRPKPDKPYYSTIFRREYDAHVAEGFDQARVLWALLAWHEDSKDQAVFQRIIELINGLDRIMIKKDDYGYYDRSTFEPDFVPNPDAGPMPHQFYFSGTQIHPLIECYRRLKIDKALELARHLTNYIIYHSDYFFEDGTWNCPGGAGFESAGMDGHTHSRFATIAGIAVLGGVTDKSDLVVKMKRCYDWFVDNHCSNSGWSPEFLGRFGDNNEGCETCAIMDQLNCCFAFTQAGYSEYYEQAERIARNQLLENQIIDMSLIRNTIEKPDTDLSCFHNVAEMVKGAFAGWASPNDFVGNCDHRYCLMNCCGPAGVRALHDVWQHIYSVKNDNIFIHIWMDKNDEYLTIRNHQPSRGLLEICSKVDCELYLLERSWLNAEQITVSVNKKRRKFKIHNGYIGIGKITSNHKVVIEYELVEHTERTTVNGRDYQFDWLGDAVVRVSPPGEIMPLYQNRL